MQKAKTLSLSLSSKLKHSWPRRTTPGFTIVELLIVIVVIAILAAIVIVSYSGIQSRARASALQSDLEQASKQLEIAYTTDNTYPADTSTLKASSGTTYQYARNTTVTPNKFCLTATNSSTSYHIASSSKPTEGPCNGHTGTTPALLSCPTGYITVPGNSLFGTSTFCTMKYEAKNDGSGNAVSTAAGTPWVSISQTTAISTANAACSGCHLISEAEWLTIAHNVLSVASNWSSGTVGTGYIYSGHNDNAPANSLAADTNDANGYSGETNTGGNQRRTLTLTNGEVIWDFPGNVREWTTGTTTGNQPGASGFAWRDWNAAFTSAGNLSPNPFPSFGTPAASSWNSTQGIGQLHSSSTDTSLRGFIRGGTWINASAAGVLSLLLNSAPGYADTYLGFRVSR